MLPQRLIIIGTDGQARIAAALAHLNGYERIMYLDDRQREKTDSLSTSVIGPVSDFCKYPEAHFFIAIDDISMRQKVFSEFQHTDCRLIPLIHPSAIISADASIGSGSLILGRSIIESRVSIGACCIVNSCVSIAHDCQIGNFCQLDTGVHINAKCRIGSNVQIGMKSIVTPGRTITAGTRIPPEAIIIKNIP